MKLKNKRREFASLLLVLALIPFVLLGVLGYIPDTDRLSYFMGMMAGLGIGVALFRLHHIYLQWQALNEEEAEQKAEAAQQELWREEKLARQERMKRLEESSDPGERKLGAAMRQMDEGLERMVSFPIIYRPDKSFRGLQDLLTRYPEEDEL